MKLDVRYTVIYAYSLCQLSPRKVAVLRCLNTARPGTAASPWEVYEVFASVHDAGLRMKQLVEAQTPRHNGSSTHST